MKKFRIFTAILCLAALFGLASCDWNDNGNDNPPVTVDEFTVTFNSNGGSAVSSQTVKTGEKAVKPSDPTRVGYTFAGWYKDAACTTPWDFAVDTVSANTNLYAKWDEVTPSGYTATLKYNNGEADGSITAVQDGDNWYLETPTTTPKKQYHEFDYWASDAEGTTKFDFAKPITTNVTLYAIYKQGFDKVYTEFVVDTASNGADISVASDTLYFGRFTLAAGMKLEASKDAINTQGKTMYFELTADNNKNSIVFNAEGASSSGDTEIKLINADTNEEIEVWSVKNKELVEKTISNLPAGNYMVTTSRSARVYGLSIVEELPQGPTTGIELNTVSATTDFLLGREFSSAGLTISLVYENGRKDDIDLENTNLTITAADFTTAGAKTVTVTYQLDSSTTYTETYEVNVYAATELVLYDYTLTAKRETVHRQEVFLKGATFSSANCVVKAKCLVEAGKYIEFLLDSSEYTFSTPDMTTTGEKVVTATYKNDNTLTAEYKIHVVEISPSTNLLPVFAVYVDPNGTWGYNVEFTPDTPAVVNTINQATQLLALANPAEATMKAIALAEGAKFYEKVEFTLPNTRIATCTANFETTTDATKYAVIEFNALNGILDPSETTTHSTDGSATVSVRASAEGFFASNVVINNYYNTHERYEESKLIAGSGTQAVALLLQADKVVLSGVTLTSYQDTLYAQEGRHFIINSTIIGRTDYIFGYDATSYFEHCTISTIGVGLDQNNGGYVVATKGNPSGTPGTAEYKNIKYGYIFNNCTFTADDKTALGSVSIARGWDKGMTVMVMNSSISGHFSKEAYGYVTPDNPDTEQTEKNLNDRYGKMNADPVASQLLEYNNTGDGAISASIENTCTVVDATVAAEYALAKAFTPYNGTTKYASSWNPVLERNAALTIKNPDDTVFLTIDNFGYVGSQAAAEEYNSIITAENTPLGKVFAGFYADKALTTEYSYETTLVENNVVYAKWEEGEKLAATTITFDSLTTGNLESEIKLENGLVTIVGNPDRKFAVDASAKTIYDVDGKEIQTVNRLKTGGSTNSKGRYIIIDLSAFSGQFEIGVYAVTGSSGEDRTGQIREGSIEGTSLAVVNCPAGTEPTYSKVTVQGGKTYYITADASINYYGINISPVVTSVTLTYDERTAAVDGWTVTMASAGSSKIGNAEGVTHDSKSADYDATKVVDCDKLQTDNADSLASSVFAAVNTVTVQVLCGTTSTSNAVNVVVEALNAEGEVVATNTAAGPAGKVAGYATVGTSKEITLKSEAADIVQVRISCGTAGKNICVVACTIVCENVEAEENVLQAWGVTADDLAAADYTTDTAWGDLGIITLNGTDGKKFTSQASNGKTVTDETGTEVKTTGRVKTNGDGRKMTIDLSEYTGSYTLEIWAATGSSDAFDRGYTISEGATVLLTHTFSTNNAEKGTVVLEGGKVYTFANFTNGINIFAINLIPVTE